MDYTQLSDFEINKRVAKALGHSIDDERYGFSSIGVFHSDGIVYKSHDYCNNPADAWPIIFSNKISTYAMSEADKRGKWGAEAFYPDNAYSFNDNPLRAAMIVFMMMQDAKHANP